VSREAWKDRIEDILEAISNLQEYVRGMTFQEFSADKRTLQAAAYEIGIIGEAARHVPPEVRDRCPEIPWDKMQGIRNVVVHEYFRLDVAILWQTITDSLPPLIPYLKRVLGE
jgi:uncharacterized protein with HEPN domain